MEELERMTGELLGLKFELGVDSSAAGFLNGHLSIIRDQKTELHANWIISPMYRENGMEGFSTWRPKKLRSFPFQPFDDTIPE